MKNVFSFGWCTCGKVEMIGRSLWRLVSKCLSLSVCRRRYVYTAVDKLKNLTHFKILGSRRIIWSEFFIEDPQICDATVTNLVATSTWLPEFMCHCICVCVYIVCVYLACLNLYVCTHVWSYGCVYVEDLCVNMFCTRVQSNMFKYLSNKCKYSYVYVVLCIHMELRVYVPAFMAVHNHLLVSLICQKHIKRNELLTHVQSRNFKQQLPCGKNKGKLIAPESLLNI